MEMERTMREIEKYSALSVYVVLFQYVNNKGSFVQEEEEIVCTDYIHAAREAEILARDKPLGRVLALSEAR